jgi:hypothetical protein
MSLADKWQFERMVEAASKAYIAFPDVPAMDKILLCQSCNIPREYLLDPYVRICTRRKSLSVEEAHAVGLETLTLIAQTREELVQRPHADGRQAVKNNLIDLKPAYFHS